MNRPGVLGSTSIANHSKKEAILNVNASTVSLAHMQGGIRGCIPITLCTINTCGHYMAITEEAGHKHGRIFWPSLDNATANLSGGGKLHCFLMADDFTQWFTSYAESLVKEHYPVIRGEIYPYKSASTHTGDNGITVKTATCFLPELSYVRPPRFFFTYRITISMDLSCPKVSQLFFHAKYFFHEVMFCCLPKAHLCLPDLQIQCHKTLKRISQQSILINLTLLSSHHAD